MPRVLVRISEVGGQDSSRIWRNLLRTLMAIFLRKIQYKTNWDRQGEFSGYIPVGQAPADALQDLKTQGNALSVWQIDDTRSNLERVLAAIASTLDHIQVINYLLIDSQHISPLNLSLVPSPGVTHDLDANSTWHFDLVHLSATDLANLANTMFTHGEKKREKDRQLALFLKKSVESGFVDQTKLNPLVIAKLSKY